METKKKMKKYYARDVLKLEIAEELGLMTKISDSGWPELTAEESGRLGGIMTKRMRRLGWF
ncbi:MAG: small, acid-soluble spore protein, alpha/beta type [Peptococcaceae bacterium]